MVLPVLRPMTLAAAAGLVTGGAFASCATVHADEYEHHETKGGGDFESRRHEESRSYPSDGRSHHYYYRHHDQSSPNGRYHHRYMSQQVTNKQDEELVPGLFYVALAGLSGSVIARQRNVMIRMASPLAFATAAGAYFLPNTTHSLLDPIIGAESSTASTSRVNRQDNTSAPLPATSRLSSSRTHETWQKTEPGAKDLGQAFREDGNERELLENAPKRWDSTRSNEVSESLDQVYKNAQPKGQHVEQNSTNESSWFHLSKPKPTTTTITATSHHLSNDAKGKMEEARDEAKEAYRDTRDWLHDKRSETEATLGHTKDRLQDKASETRENVKQRWNSQTTKAEDKARELESKAKEAAQETKHWWNNKTSEAGEKAHELQDKAAETTKEVKHWWNKTSTQTGEKVKELESQAKDTAHDVKHWWGKHSTEAEHKLGELKEKAKDVSHHAGETLSDLKDKSIEVKSWVETKAHDAGKVAVDVSAKASDAAHKTKDWVEDKQVQVDKKLEASVKEADEWWKTQAQIEAKKEKARLAKEKKDAEQQWWFHRKKAESAAGGPGGFSSAYTTSDSLMDGLLDEKDIADHWTPTNERAAAATTPETVDRWSNGEEIGTAQIRPDDKARRVPKKEAVHSRLSSAYTTSDSLMDGLLDEKDIADHWSTTNDRAGAADTKGSKSQIRSWAEKDVDLLTRPQKREYWSNGEEIGTANVRDADYYNYIGSFAGSSVGRDSWWDRHVSQSEQTASDLKDKAESLVWETKMAAERAASELADRLAHEQSVLERSAAAAKVRAEEAARQAQAQSDRLLRERQAAVEKAAKDMEMRLAADREATERAAQEVKVKATAWENEQRMLAEQAAKAVEDRVTHEKRVAEHTAAQLKARVETWAREQKERAEVAAKEVNARVHHETAIADKNAREAKAALEAKLKAEKLEAERVTRELQQRMRLQKGKEENTAHELDASKRTAEKEAKSTGWGWGWPWWSSTTPKSETPTKTSTAEIAHKETLKKEAVPTASERGGLFTPKSAGNTAELGRNVEAAAIKAELDVKARAPQFGRNMDETAKKAYDNVVDAASTVDGQRSATHTEAHGHEHGTPESTPKDDGYHLIDHLREDIRQTKEGIQHGVEVLKETVFGAEHPAAEKADTQAAKAKEQAGKAVNEGKSWWNAKTKEAEKKLGTVQEELDLRVNKAGEKLHEMGREAKDSEAEFWLKTEQRRQQNERRESGRAM
ncbi:MAG: hypothetical protein J3Q66DRAFT_443142 [Benniella sp.]|nr:MAG: hypothetical protein J3Q66DRAFT_443142 [Benniella sp.]